jgi:hypothetical protein
MWGIRVGKVSLWVGRGVSLGVSFFDERLGWKTGGRGCEHAPGTGC